jgi:MFS family permease
MFRLLRALQNRPFALVWAGQTVSLLGDRIFQVALAWWVLEKTGSALAMGAVFIFSTIPMLVFLLIGGVLVDRFPRLWLMLISDLAGGLVICSVAVLAYTDQATNPNSGHFAGIGGNRRLQCHAKPGLDQFVAADGAAAFVGQSDQR